MHQRLGNSLMKEQEVAIWKWSESKETVPGCNRGFRELKGLLGFPGSIEGALQPWVLLGLIRVMEEADGWGLGAGETGSLTNFEPRITKCKMKHWDYMFLLGAIKWQRGYIAQGMKAWALESEGAGSPPQLCDSISGTLSKILNSISLSSSSVKWEKSCLLLRATARVKWEKTLSTVPHPALEKEKSLTIIVLLALLIKFKIPYNCKSNNAFPHHKPCLNASWEMSAYKNLALNINSFSGSVFFIYIFLLFLLQYRAVSMSEYSQPYVDNAIDLDSIWLM